MNISVRSYDGSHAKEAAQIISDLVPEWVVNEQMLLHWERSKPERARYQQWVAAGAGEVAGYAGASLDSWTTSSGAAFAWAGVREQFRRQGLGTELFNAAEEHLRSAGATKIKTFVREPDLESVAFVESRGYRPGRRGRTWILPPGKADLTGLDEGVRALEDSGFQLVQLGQLRDKPKELHEMFA
ncbi:MAG TPA: GNAT family N-acetyltransferase, partial [Actinomycetota bacterium]|nr:GNAT family N-acetyltransferase [Actinomycetota bacterium]